MWNKMEHSRVNGDFPNAALVFCCVRSKECFCFVLIGMVLQNCLDSILIWGIEVQNLEFSYEQ